MRHSKVVRIRLLGGFSVSVGSRTIAQNDWRLRKAATLVKLLALAPTHHLHREQVMEVLWPELGIHKASNNLHQILHAARRALTSDPAEGSRYLASQGRELRAVAEAVEYALSEDEDTDTPELRTSEIRALPASHLPSSPDGSER